MAQDIRNFFVRTPGKGSSESTKVSASVNKNKKRYIVDSDSDDDFQSPKTKKNKTVSRGKSSETTPKSNKKVSLGKTETSSKYFEVTKASVDSILGTDPVKRSSVPKRKAIKAICDEFEDDEGLAEAFMQIDDGSIEEWNKEKSLVSSGFGSQTSGTLSQISLPITPEKEQNRITSPEPCRKNETISPKHTSPIKEKSSPAKHELKSKRSPSKKLLDILPESKKETNVRNLSHKEICSKSSEIEPKKCKVLSPVKFKENLDVKENVKFSPVKRNVPLESGLWVDKYKPSNIKQIIGQQGERSNVNKLLKWLRDWHLNQSGTKKLVKPSPWAKDDSGAYFKAALLSGPPGVGKTTTAHLVCKELDMDMVEFNASDTRSKKLLNQEVGELLSTKSLSPFFISNGGGEVTKRHVLVMDEVDGMAGNEDRGGVQELILLIKSAKVPVICMCNDRNHPKIRSLANYCFDLRFNKPRADQIKGAMLSVCFKEKLKIKPDVLMDIIVNTNQDIRLVLNHLSMVAASSDEKMKASTKDIKIGPWDVLKKVFSEEDHKTMSIHDKSDLFFNDYSIAPLFVQENYLMVVPHSPVSKTKLGKMELFAKAATSIANGDLVDRAIRTANAWSLLPTQAMFSSMIPGDLLEGHMGGQISFPLWLGKNSKKNKLDRLTQEIQSHTRLRMSGSKEDVKLDYAKSLYDSIVGPLARDGSEGTESSLNVMREYSLLREDLDSLSQLCDWNLRPDPFTKLDSKVKAAFTRSYNKCPVMSPFAQISAVKKKGKRGDDQDYGSGEEAELSEPDDDDDDITTDAMIMVKKKTEKKVAEKKVAAKAEPSSSRTSKRGGGSSSRGGKRGSK